MLTAVDYIQVAESVINFVKRFAEKNPKVRYLVMYGTSAELITRPLVEAAWRKLYPGRSIEIIMLENYEERIDADSQVNSGRFYMSRDTDADFRVRAEWFRGAWKEKIESRGEPSFAEAVEQGLVAFVDDHSMSGHKLKESHHIMTEGMPRGTQIPVGAVIMSAIAARELEDNQISNVSFGNLDGRPADNFISAPGFEAMMRMVIASTDVKRLARSGDEDRFWQEREELMRHVERLEPMIYAIVDSSGWGRPDNAMLSSGPERGYGSLSAAAKSFIDADIVPGLRAAALREAAEDYYAANQGRVNVDIFIEILDTNTRDLAVERQFAATVLGEAGSGEALDALRRNSFIEFEPNDYVRVDVLIALAKNQDLDRILNRIAFDPSPMVRRFAVELLKEIDTLDVSGGGLDRADVAKTVEILHRVQGRGGNQDPSIGAAIAASLSYFESLGARSGAGGLSPLAADIINTLGNEDVRSVAMASLVYEEGVDAVLNEILATTEPQFASQRADALKVLVQRSRLNVEVEAESVPDNAMIGEEVGGIDLNPQNWSFEETGDIIEFQAPPQPFENLEGIDGLYPVIINISPVTNLPLLLGQSQEKEPEELSYLNPAR